MNMKKDFNKKYSRRQRLAAGLFVTVLLCSIGFFTWQSQSAHAQFSLLCARMNDWMNERKTRLHHNLVQVKQLAANSKNTHQEIHYEFYTALTNMRVPVHEAPVEKNIIAENKSVMAVNETVTVPKVVKPANLFNADNLQQSMQAEINTSSEVASANQYVVQMGVFKQSKGAEKFRQSFARTGFATRVVKVTLAKGKAYSVQAGPFNSKNQAVLAQQQLQKKKVSGIIRRI